MTVDPTRPGDSRPQLEARKSDRGETELADWDGQVPQLEHRNRKGVAAQRATHSTTKISLYQASSRHTASSRVGHESHRHANWWSRTGYDTVFCGEPSSWLLLRPSWLLVPLRPSLVPERWKSGTTTTVAVVICNSCNNAACRA